MAGRSAGLSRSDHPAGGFDKRGFFAENAAFFLIRERRGTMAAWCIGIDLGGTFIKFGLLSEDRRLRGVFQLPTRRDGGADGIVAQIVSGVKQLMTCQELPEQDEVVAVGIGAPGPLKITEGTILAMPNIPGMENVPLRDRLSSQLNLPVVLENDANAGAYGEYLCGAGQGASDLVMLTLGTGVGSGIIVDGSILHGSHEIGGELGHMIIEPGGEPCGCGQRGCLERYCSATYLAERAVRMIRQEGRGGRLEDVLRRKGQIDAKDINEARKAGDELAEQLWDSEAYYLALACVNICRIFDPEKIVLAGGLTRAGEDLLRPLREHFARLHWTLTEPRTEIALASLGDNAGIIGAAGIGWRALRLP